MRLVFLFFFCTLPFLLSGDGDYNNHYNPYRNRTVPSSKRTPEPEKPSDQPEEPNSNPLILEAEPDLTPHSPLGAICRDTYLYGHYFLEYRMNDPFLKTQKNTVALFCDVLELLANIADADVGTIRLNTYITNLTKIMRGLRVASEENGTIDARHFPLMNCLHQNDVDDTNTALLVHHALREQTTGAPLLTELVAELQTYTSLKLHAALDGFKNDTHQFLLYLQRIASHSAQQDTLPLTEIERQSKGSLGWLCKHAANTCIDLSQVIPASPLLSHTGTLMNQIHEILTTMALTYQNLSNQSVRSQDQQPLVDHYLTMVENLKEIGPRRGQTSLIQHLRTLPSQAEKKSFLAKLFTNEQESDAFLREFFPSLNDSLDYNLAQFCSTLTLQITDIFAHRYWTLGN